MDRQILNRATDSTDTPTPGYLYVDISRNVNTSTQASFNTIIYLTHRLSSKSNHNVKYKCLKVFDMVSKNSITHGQFKRSVRQNTAAIIAIKNCLNFRGPPDPVRGDDTYTRIRNQAKETLNTIYSDSNCSAASPSLTYRYGHENTSGRSSVVAGKLSIIPSAAGQKKMEGIGNPMYKDSRVEQSSEQAIGTMTMKQIAGAAIEGFAGIIRDPLARNSVAGKNFGGNRSAEIDKPRNTYGYGQASKGWKIFPPGQNQLSNATNGEWTMASNRGPNAVGIGNVDVTGWSKSSPGDDTEGSLSCNKVSVSVPPLTVTPEIPFSSNIITSSAGVSAVLDGNYERNLIMELCPPGGMRAEPPHDKLQSFTQAISSLNPDLVCPALLDALEDGQPWIIRAKALCVIEVVINVAEEMRQKKENNAYADFFHACIEEIEPLSRHSRAAIRDPCKRVLKALGIDVVEQQPSSLMVSKDKNDLLRFPELAPPSPPGVSSSQNCSSLFGGMTVKEKFAPSQASQVHTEDKNVTTDLLIEFSNEPTKVETMIQLSPEPTLCVGENIASLSTTAEVVVNDLAKNNNLNCIEREDLTSSNTTSSAFSFIASGGNDDNFDPLLKVGTPDALHMTMTMKKPIIEANSQIKTIHQKPSFVTQMQPVQKNTVYGTSLCYMTQHGQTRSEAASSTNLLTIMPIRQTCIMEGPNITGAATSFAFLEDPAKLQKEVSNRKFDFVKDAMKSAK